jgi:AcrR family transcriptional regulator
MDTAAEPQHPDLEPGTAPRRRADWAISRQKIIETASELFARRGYRRTSTAELAQAAGVSESTLFRHFPTKTLLFEDAVVAPIRSSIDGIAERRRRAPRDVSTEQGAYTVYEEILRAMRKDSGLLIAALAVLTFEEDPEQFSGLASVFSDLLAYLDEIIQFRAAERDYYIDPVIGARTVLATALGFALAERMLFEGRSVPDLQRLSAELAKLTAYGLPGRPPDDS